MAQFSPFDLREPLMAASQLNAIREQSNYRRLQEAALDERLQWECADREQSGMQRAEEQQLANTKWLHDASETALQSSNPNNAIRALVNEAKRRGIFTPESTLTTDELRELNGNLKVQLGMVPAPKSQVIGGTEAEQLGFRPGTTVERTAQGGYQVLQQPEATKPIEIRSFRALTPDEVRQAGLPDGTAAQLDESTGKIDVLSKRDNTNTLSQKDRTTAQMKLNTVNLAREQLADIQAKFNKIKNSLSAGPLGQGRAPTKDGQAFDRSVDAMRSTLTALTRVPGVGAMSDYETRLDQAKFPTRTDYEEVTQQSIDQIAKQLNLIELGYTDLLGEEQPAQQTQPEQPAGAPQVGAVEDGYRFLGGDPSKPESWEKVR